MKKFFRVFLALLTGKKYVAMGEPAKGETKSITLGKRDENGFCNVIIDGKETTTKMLVFDREKIERWQKISDEIRDEEVVSVFKID